MRRACGSAAVLLFMLSLLAACGDSQNLTASELIDRINAEGVSIVLGERLAAGGEADELYAVRLPPLPGEPKPPPNSEAEPGASGSLYVFGDSGAADDQVKACQASAGLFCFRAQNIAVILDEGSSALEVRRLGVAVGRLDQ